MEKGTLKCRRLNFHVCAFVKRHSMLNFILPAVQVERCGDWNVGISRDVALSMNTCKLSIVRGQIYFVKRFQSMIHNLKYINRCYI